MRHPGKSRQELKAGTELETIEVQELLACFSGLSSAVFLTVPSPTCLWTVPPAVGRALLPQLAVENFLHRYAQGTLSWKQCFSSVSSSFLRVQVTTDANFDNLLI